MLSLLSTVFGCSKGTDNKETESERFKSELELSLEADTTLKDVSKEKKLNWGTDKDYGFYYELSYSDSDNEVVRDRFYESDNVYDTKETVKDTVIIETGDYWFIVYVDTGVGRVLLKPEVEHIEESILSFG